MSWADEAGDGGMEGHFSAERIVSQSADGREKVKIITEIRKNDNGERVKVERKVKVMLSGSEGCYCVQCWGPDGVIWADWLPTSSSESTRQFALAVSGRSSENARVNRNCEQHGFKETGVVNISEQVMFELAGMDESQKTQEPAKGVGALLNMDTFSALRHLRSRVTSGEITEDQVPPARRGEGMLTVSRPVPRGESQAAWKESLGRRTGSCGREEGRAPGLRSSAHAQPRWWIRRASGGGESNSEGHQRQH
eukprot:753371-Hanusia_phi.AAC.2